MFGLIYSVVSYLGFLATFVYLACFSDGVLVPKHVDSGAPGPVALALTVNLGLILLFGLQHSVMAREGFKRGLTRIVPQHLERATFVLASWLVLALLMWQWRPLNGELWSVDNTALVAVLWAVNALGWLGVPFVSFLIDHFDLFGVKQAFNAFRRASMERQGFVTPLLYKYVRHPMMTCLFIAFWVTPHMSVGHLLLSLGMSAYILIGVHFEERALARELGSAYVGYQASTPKFLPFGGSKREAAASVNPY
jgi:protein-S-isoprenylcysteine O-methyltransferase Ste14